MRTLRDPDRLLAQGLDAIRAQFAVPPGFPPHVLAAADAATARRPADHADWTGKPFVTLDPAASTDLDQAFAIEAAGADWLLHYAIADVAWFVADDDPLDREAWARGVTTYLPDGKAGLYPPALSEAAASLLPDGDRPAIVLTVRVAPDGMARLDGARRALIRSRAKLAYETATEADLPAGFAEIAARVAAAEDRRGAARVDPPEQEVEPRPDGGFALRFRPYSPVERQNAALSLAANLAVADALLAARTGLFREMAPPDAQAEGRLRQTARAFALDWPEHMPLAQFERRLDPARPPHAAFMMAIRRAGNGASYAPYRPGQTPWHAAMAATYAHATAPLRRLADRHVLRAVLAVANGQAVDDRLDGAFRNLPAAMARSEQRARQVERAVIDLAEAALLTGLEGDVFSAVVTDTGENGARIQLCDLPVVSRAQAHGVMPGDRIRVRLQAADPVRRETRFERVG